jgi:predicted branched-subunit amino acid permease
MSYSPATPGQHVPRDGAGSADAWGSRFRAGVLLMAPLLVGVIPFALVFGASARTEGWSTPQVMALSGLLFAGSAQLAVVSLVAGGAAPASIVLAVAVLNLRHVLYGMSLSREIPRDEPPPRWLLAPWLTDESYAITIREARAGRASAALLWGASLALYLTFVPATLAGVLLGDRIPDPTGLGLDLVFPLVFFSLLLLVIRGWRDVVVAVIAAALVMGLRQVVDGGSALVGATIIAALAGALVLERPRG